MNTQGSKRKGINAKEAVLGFLFGAAVAYLLWMAMASMGFE
jgi:type III secretory pathway component EscT